MKSIHEVHQHNVSKFLHEEKLVSDISGTSMSRRSYPFRKERWKWKSLEKTFLSLSGKVRKDLHISLGILNPSCSERKRWAWWRVTFQMVRCQCLPNGHVICSRVQRQVPATHLWLKTQRRLLLVFVYFNNELILDMLRRLCKKLSGRRELINAKAVTKYLEENPTPRFLHRP